jgi:hypothetical protein
MTTMKISRRQAATRNSAARGPIQYGLAAALIGTGFAWAMPAQAQWYERPPGYDRPEPYDRAPPVFRGNARPLSPDAIVERLEERGFEDVGRPRYNGSTYQVDATSPRGQRMRIVIDAFQGNVVERFALGRTPDDLLPGRPAPQRGWFGNNVQPPEEMPLPRRYSNRPPDEEDDGADVFDRLSRPTDRRLAPAPRVDVGPPVAGLPPAPSNRLEPGQPLPSGEAPARTAARPRDVAPSAPERQIAPQPVPQAAPQIAPERQAARPDPDLGKVEGVNPSAIKPAARTPQNGQAGKPENNRQFEAARTDPAARKPASRPAESAAAPISPPAPAPAIAAPAAPIAEKPAVTAETARPDKPVRVIGGVTPMHPDDADPKKP